MNIVCAAHIRIRLGLQRITRPGVFARLWGTQYSVAVEVQEWRSGEVEKVTEIYRVSHLDIECFGLGKGVEPREREEVCVCLICNVIFARCGTCCSRSSWGWFQHIFDDYVLAKWDGVDSGGELPLHQAGSIGDDSVIGSHLGSGVVGSPEDQSGCVDLPCWTSRSTEKVSRDCDGLHAGVSLVCCGD